MYLVRQTRRSLGYFDPTAIFPTDVVLGPPPAPEPPPPPTTFNPAPGYYYDWDYRQNPNKPIVTRIPGPVPPGQKPAPSGRNSSAAAATPPPPTTPPDPSKKSPLAKWWETTSSISDSLTNGNLVEIGGVFLGSMILIGMLRRNR